MDFSHCTLLPGPVDCHVHLFMSGTDGEEEREWQLKAPYESIKTVIRKDLMQQLDHGVVAVRDGGDYAGHTLRYKKECLATDGFPIYLKSAGRAWRASGRYGKLIGRPAPKGSSLARCIGREKDRIDHVKVVNSGVNSLLEYGKETAPQFSLDHLSAGVRAAGELRLKTMVHANGTLPVKAAVEAGCHSIEHGFFMGRENLERLSQSHITWVPTAYTMKGYHKCLKPESPGWLIARKNLEHQLDQMRLARQFGVQIAVGTDAGSLGVHHGSALIEEIKLLMQAGFPLEFAIRCSTANGARVLGLEKELGQLGAGMPATFVATQGAPDHLPEALRSPIAVFSRGKQWKCKKSDERS